MIINVWIIDINKYNFLYSVIRIIDINYQIIYINKINNWYR